MSDAAFKEFTYRDAESLNRAETGHSKQSAIVSAYFIQDLDQRALFVNSKPEKIAGNPKTPSISYRELDLTDTFMW